MKSLETGKKPIDITFQTREANEAAEAEIELALAILRTAKQVLVDAVRKAIPVGSIVRKQVGSRRHSEFEVVRYSLYSDTSLAEVKNRRTGKFQWLDMGGEYRDVELLTYAYRVEEIGKVLDSGKPVSYSFELEAERCRLAGETIPAMVKKALHLA